MESINVVLDDAEISDYFSDDEDGITFSPSPKQVMNKDMNSPYESESENEKKKESAKLLKMSIQRHLFPNSLFLTL